MQSPEAPAALLLALSGVPMAESWLWVSPSLVITLTNYTIREILLYADSIRLHEIAQGYVV